MQTKWIGMVALSAVLCAQTRKPPLYFNWNNQNFSANGRWVPSDPKEKAAFSSETQIDCDRVSKTCVEATAEYYSGHPHVSLRYYDILKWDDDGIIATTDALICEAGTVMISFAEKSITSRGILKTMDDKKREACKTLGSDRGSSSVFIIKNSERWLADPYGESLTGRF
jgi:hypothetical protein